MHIRRTQSVLVLLLVLTLTFACGKQKEGPQNADPSTDNEETTSEVPSAADTSGTEQEQENHGTAEQENTTSESEQEATFKVGGMVTRFGMV